MGKLCQKDKFYFTVYKELIQKHPDSSSQIQVFLNHNAFSNISKFTLNIYYFDIYL